MAASSSRDSILRFSSRQECTAFIAARGLAAWPHESFLSGRGLSWIAVFRQDGRMFAAISSTSAVLLPNW